MHDMQVETIATYQATIYIAGDLATARAFLRREAYESWLCVSLLPIEYVFTGALEVGVAIGFVAYPQVPKTSEQIFERARDIAARLIPALGQQMALVVASDRTVWLTTPPPGAHP
jgi:predicted signal transduction protein with EAL and GGDEF domain